MAQEPKVINASGDPWSWTALRSVYGDVRYKREKVDQLPEEGVLIWRLVRVKETHQIATCTIRLKETSERQDLVAFYWPEPEEPIDLRGGQGFKSLWFPQVGAVQYTENNQTGFGLGGGSYYSPPEVGPHAAWILSKEAYSDVALNFGMLANTNHHGILDWTFELRRVRPSPTPPPEGEQIIEVDLKITGTIRIGAEL